MKKGRLLLFIEPGGRGELSSELEQAVKLARRLGACIDAILLTDEELLRAAQLPITREVGQSSAKIFPFEVGDLEDQLEDLKTEIEQNLASASRHFGVPWTLTVRSGPLKKQLVATGNGTEWLALMGTGMRPRNILRLLAADPGFLTRKVIVTCSVGRVPFPRGTAAVVFFGKLTKPAVDLCRRIAERLASSEKLAFFSESISDDIKFQPNDSQHRLDPGKWEPEALLDLVEQTNAEAIIVVLPEESAGKDREALEQFIGMADVPVVILPGKETSSESE